MAVAADAGKSRSEDFAILRSYLSTRRKQSDDTFNSLVIYYEMRLVKLIPDEKMRAAAETNEAGRKVDDYSKWHVDEDTAGCVKVIMTGS